VDFAEFFTQAARETVSIAWSRDLLFLFDYRGPFIDIDADASSMHRAVRRLANGVLGLLDDGFIFLSAQVDWNDEGVVDIAISAAGTGHRANDARVSATLHALGLQELARDPSTPEGTRIATGVCPMTGSIVSFAANRSDGILFGLDLTVPATLIDDLEQMPSADGARAWLVSDTPGTYQSLVRRLQRLGWATSTFATPQQARAHLRELEPGMARPLLVVGAESRIITDGSMAALRDVLPSRTQVVLASTLERHRDDDGSGIEHRTWPFSPAELVEMTRRVHGAAPLYSGETMPAPLTFRDRPQALVVDDNAVNLMVASGLLQVAGFEVRTAASGEDAIAQCRALAPQLVLMDVHMPGMDGLQTTRRMRTLQREGALPNFAIVAATADSVDLGYIACHEAGMDGYLSKPLSLQAIEGEVDRLLPGLRHSMHEHGAGSMPTQRAA
jgi:CheY-like chemotaxis protein